MSAPLIRDDSVTASSCSSAGTTLPRSPVEPALALDNGSGQKLLTKEDSELVGDKPQDAAQGDRTIVDRLTQEAAAMDPSSAEYQRRIRQLERDVRSSKVKSARNSNTGMFKAMCSTDLLFLIDTTASMMGHINAAKTQVRNIVDAVMDAFFGDAEIRVAVVGYKDHRDKPNIQYLDFVKSAERVKVFLSDLKAKGGGDIPEDVLGGIRQALHLSWKHPTKCIIHIADAPPHGTMYHTTACADDSYPTAGTEPHRLFLGPLVDQMISLKINYALLRINASTDRMAYTIYQAYNAAGAQCKLRQTNKCYPKVSGNSSTSRTLFEDSNAAAKAALQFEEAELGTSYSALQHLVVKNVTTSVSRTICASSGRARKPYKKLVGLGAIDENSAAARRVSLEVCSPQWQSVQWFNQTLLVEGFSPDIVVHGATTLNDMLAADDNIRMTTSHLTIRKRSQPFAQGAMRVAHYARTASSTNRFVVKAYKKNGKRLAHLAEDMRLQALCKAFALEFNALSEESRPIDFIVTTCFRDKRGKSSNNECMSLEPFLEGTYIKHNNNSGWINDRASNDPFHLAAQAFSHFTFERSRGQFCVTDLQGVGGLLTDPAVHALDRKRFRLSDTNLGAEGFKFFFATHVCNRICNKLKLRSSGSMIKSGWYDFREDWPKAIDTVSCSNKLCGRIIHLDDAKECDSYPGYRWCHDCWLQLDESMANFTCVAPGPLHEFEVSRFFVESQGQPVPRRCATHRIGGEIAFHHSSKISQSDLSKLFTAGDVQAQTQDTIQEEEEDEEHELKANEKPEETKSCAVERHGQVQGERKGFASALKSALKGLACFT